MNQETERAPSQEQSAEELREILQIRRNKLSQLQAEGRDPFREVRYDRTHHTRDITEHFDEMENQTVSVRLRTGEDLGAMSLADFTARIQQDVDTKAIW